MDALSPITAASQESIPWLSLIVLLPVVGALVIPFLPKNDKDQSNLPRNIALTFLSIDFLLIVGVITNIFNNKIPGIQLEERVSWIPLIGLEWSLGIDGISSPLILLSGLVTLLSAAASWNLKRKKYF